MEQRFRERVEHTGPVQPAPTTGAIDERVQDEMRQFFSESTQKLEAIVPTLEARAGHDASETTGEIRRKIDAFFGEAGGSGMIRSERTMAIEPASDRPPPVVGFERPSVPAASGALSAAPGLRRDAPHDDYEVPVAATTHLPPTIRRSEDVEIPEPAPAGSVRPSLPRPARRSSAPAADRPPMDLKSALERLRRHGVVRDPAAAAADARQVAPRPAPAASPPQVARPAARPQRAEDSRQLPPLGGTRPGSQGAHGDPRIGGQLLDTGPVGRSVIPDVDPSERARMRSPEPVTGFDDIFAEVEDLVRGTLADSIEETFAEARAQETVLRDEIAAIPQPALSSLLSRPEDDEPEEEDAAPDESPAGPYNWGVKSAERPRGAWLLEDGAEEAVRARLQGAAAAAPPAVPEPPVLHEDLLEDTAEIEVVVPATRAAAYESGPRSTPVDLSEPPEADCFGVDSEPVSVAPPLPADGGRGGGGGGGGGGGAANGILARKLEAETSRFAPLLDQLVADGVVDAKDLSDDEPEDDDDEISVASFQDNRPRGDDQGMTPMRIIEEIRRLRRIQELLVSKGLVSEGEISSPASDDD